MGLAAEEAAHQTGSLLGRGRLFKLAGLCLGVILA